MSTARAPTYASTTARMPALRRTPTDTASPAANDAASGVATTTTFS